MKNTFISGSVMVSDQSVPQVSVTPGFSDFLGSVKVRWGIGRNNYRVEPGLYAAGNPDPDSDVFVTANYKLSFDVLRGSLSGISGWILVLDTKGVNVWCSAGKGVFGTSELVNRIRQIELDCIVRHKRLILPQLSATGVAAHKVKEATGFNIHYGPVRASDLKQFISNGYRASEEMRKVTFGFADRLKLVPNDFVYGKFYFLGAAILFFLISGLSKNGLSFRDIADKGGLAILRIFAAYFAGIVITPLLLPYIPWRYFSLKGFFSGTAVFIALFLLNSSGNNLPEIVSWFLIITAISSFTAMNFTGSSTFTSLSGVRKEMKIFVPFQIGFIATGIILQVIGKLIN